MDSKEYIVELDQVFLSIVSTLVLLLDGGNEVEGDGKYRITKESNYTGYYEING